MEHIKQKILLTDFIDKTLVRKQPVCRPRIEKYECVSHKNKLGLIGNYCRRGYYPIDRERMRVPEIRLELRVRNVSALASWAGLPLLGRRAVLFVTWFWLFFLWPWDLLLFRLWRLGFRRLFWGLCFFLAPRRIDFRLSWGWSNRALFCWLLLIRRARILPWLLRVQEYGQTPEQNSSYSDSDVIHNVLSF
jgi:hypothetical protein